MDESLKDKIIKLRGLGKTYKQIVEELNCKKSLVAYHCVNNNLGCSNYKVTNKIIEDIRLYRLNHTIKECVKKFGLNKSTITKYTKNENIKIPLDEEQKRLNNYNRVKKYRQNLKEKSVNYKGGCCEKCGYDKCIWALEFHHLDPNKKDFTISKNVKLSWDKLIQELDKCILVCSNCHRELHYNQHINK